MVYCMLSMGEHLQAMRLRQEGYDWGAMSQIMKIPPRTLRYALRPAAQQRIRKRVKRETPTQPPASSD